MYLTVQFNTFYQGSFLSLFYIRRKCSRQSGDCSAVEINSVEIGHAEIRCLRRAARGDIAIYRNEFTGFKTIRIDQMDLHLAAE